MKAWPVQDAKARFSEFLDACLSEGPQMVTRRGAETAVLVPAALWEQMQSAARPSLKELLLSEDARTDKLAPVRSHERGKARRRRVEALR
ncbi:MAG TPA: type II toxin-antitoxin system Phd/YefM family antitoxin [Burkholderiaceae bacterium]|nr:type II toxin-antitoxin system Phd/YefM family antitoxin [Burkholderiaceae bacterium]